MVDRLAELGPLEDKGQMDIESNDYSQGGGGGGEDGEKFMADFFKEVGRIKAEMASIRRNTKLIEQKHQQSLTAISVDAGKQSNEELEELMDETNAASQRIRNNLKKLEEESKSVNPHSAEGRIRNSMNNSLARKFVDIMKEYQDVQQKYKNKYKERMARQYKIVNPSAKQEEIDEVLESGNAKSVFAEKILTPSHAAARNALADIQEKHQDILKLERSLEELHQLFVDMAILVEAQGELLDQIETHVMTSQAYVEKGIDNLDKAVKYQKSYRKKLMFLCCCLTIILGIVVAVIAGVLKMQHVY